MTRLAIVGCGKMGRLVETLAEPAGFEVCARFDSANNSSGTGITHESLNGAQVAIEFTNALAAAGNIRKLAETGVNVVCGTTGWYADLEAVAGVVEKNETALVWGANFSIGVNLFSQIVAQAAHLFASRPEYGAWAWEIHHAAKKDAPSGTLLRLVEGMKDAGYARPVDLSSSRAGNVPGTHEIGFDSVADTVTLRHTARSREGFARGALFAANWVMGRRGVFEFRDLIVESRTEKQFV